MNSSSAVSCPLWTKLILLLVLVTRCYAVPVIIGTRKPTPNSNTVPSPRDRNMLNDPVPLSTKRFDHTAAGTQANVYSFTGSSTEPLRLDINVIEKCRRTERRRQLKIANCRPIRVDVGQCAGGCTAKELPTPKAVRHSDGVYRFETIRVCKCCQAKETEIRTHTLQCGASVKTVQVEHVTKCQCRKCDKQTQ